ncbi:MAG: hypothetical protein QM757_34130, partial [Paludibaculum sp.]
IKVRGKHERIRQHLVRVQRHELTPLPIVFALSVADSASHRAAVRDGVLYGNKVLGREMLRVIDAPAGYAPSPKFNVIEWIKDRAFGSTRTSRMIR